MSLEDLSPSFLTPMESVASLAAPAQSLAAAAEQTDPPPASTGQAVVDAEREGWTPTSHWWINDDGGKSVESFTKPMFFRDEAGRWGDFDMHLEGASDGSALVPRRAPKDAARVARRATVGAPLLTVRGEHGTVGVSYVGVAGADVRVEQARTAHFEDALSAGRDIRVELTTTGFKDAVVVPSAQGGSSYELRFSLPAGLTARQAGAGLEFVAVDGQVVARYGGGVAFEPDTDAGLPGAEAPVQVTLLEQSGTSARVSVGVDDGWFSAAERRFPVTIDPYWLWTQWGRTDGLSDGTVCEAAQYSDSYSMCDTYVNSDNPTGKYSGQHELRLGSPGYQEAGAPTGTKNRTRTYLRWATDSLGTSCLSCTPPIDHRYKVTYATVTMYPFASSSSLTRYFDLYQPSAEWGGDTAWGNQPGRTSTTAAASAAIASAGTDRSWVVTSVVNGWIHQGAPNRGVVIWARDEHDTASFRRFDSGNTQKSTAPRLYIEYIDKPGTPSVSASTGASATSGANSGTARVTWTAPSAGGGTISKYTVRAYPTNGGTTPAASPVTVCGTCARDYTFTGLSNNKSYYFTVIATNESYDGPAGKSGTVTTPIVAPTPPQNVSAAMGTGSAVVSWAHPVDNGGTGLSHYMVETFCASTCTTTPPAPKRVDYCSTCTSTPITGLENNVSYRFGVTAINLASKTSTRTDTTGTTNLVPPAAPVDVTATSGELGQSTVNWNPGPPRNTGGDQISSYTVRAYNGTALEKTVTGICSTCRPYAVSGLKNNTSYTFTVQAHNAAGSSSEPHPRSNVITTAVDKPGMPGSARAEYDSVEPNRAHVTWTPPADDGGEAVSKYQITVLAHDGGAVPAPLECTAGQECFLTGKLTVSGLTNGKTYSFRVAAANSKGYGPGLESNRTTLTGTPDVQKAVAPDAPNSTGVYSSGDGLTYSITVKNPHPDRPLTVDRVTDVLPAGLALSAKAATVNGELCSTCVVDLATRTITVSSFTLAAGASRTISVQVVAVGRDLGCSVINNVAAAENKFGRATSEQTPVPITVCDTGLGLEKWWSTVDRPLGPQSTAFVNAASGNLVVQAVDSTPVQGHGDLGYVLRRTYNSSDRAVASLPGSIGAGWQLNVGQTGDMAAGLGANGLYVPTQNVLRPLAVTLIDRDGTRHVFNPRAVNVKLNLSTLAAPAGAVAPRVLRPAAGAAICVDQPYDAPRGVHLGLWRYLQVTTTASDACAAATASNTKLLGFAAVRPDRVRYEFSATGRLLDMVDGAGVALRHVYDNGTPDVAGSRLTAVYEPRSCTTTQTGSTVTAADIPSTCRAFRVNYVPISSTDPRLARVEVRDPAGRLTSYHLDTASPQRLVKVDNPNGSSVAYTYGGCGGSASQMCTASDPRGGRTAFTYGPPRNAISGAPAVLASLTDRRSSRTTFSYTGSATVVDEGTHRTVFNRLDAHGRAGLIEQGNTSNTMLRSSTFVWDTATTCSQPAGKQDHNLCRVERAAGSTPQVTRYVYNHSGQVLREHRDNGSDPSITTFGYRSQHVSGSKTDVYTDSVVGAGAHTFTTPAQPPSTLFVLSDRTEQLPPRGNAAGATVPAFRTTWDYDANQATAANTAVTGTICASTARSNTGLVCSSSAPASAGTTATVTSHTYDTFGQKLTTRTPKAHATGSTQLYRYSYYADGDRDLSGTTEAGGWLKAVTDPSGAFVAFGYDAAGNRARTWDRNATAGTTISAYPGAAPGGYSQALRGTLGSPWRYVTAQTDPLGKRTSYVLDANGNQQTIRPPRGNAAGTSSFDVTQTFDVGDLTTTRTTPAGRVDPLAVKSWRFDYDPFGNQTLRTDPNGHATQVVYDSVNRTVRTRWSRGGTGPAPTACPVAPSTDTVFAGQAVCFTENSYDRADNLLTARDADGQVSRFGYDQLGRPTSATSPLRGGTLGHTGETQTQTVYDVDGNPVRICPPREFTEGSKACGATAAFSIHHSYDPAGRLSETLTYRTAPTTGSDGVVVRVRRGYDADGNETSLINGRDAETLREVDLLGRVRSETRPRTSAADVKTTQWRYDPVGNVTAVIAPGGRRTAYSYDRNHRPVDTVVGASTEKASTSGLADGTSNTRTRLVYDADGNITGRYGPRAFTASLTSPDPRFLTRIDVDADGRPVARWSPRYDSGSASPLGSSTSQTAQCPTGAAGYPAELGVCVTRSSYDPSGNLTVLELPTATENANRKLTYRYSHDNLLEQVLAPSPQDSTQITAAAFVYDGNGRRVKASDANGVETTTTYLADGLIGQSELEPNGTVRHVTTFGYDGNGNRTQLRNALQQTVLSIYTPDNLLASVTDSSGVNKTSYSYDLAGNPSQVFSPSANARDTTNPSGTATQNTFHLDDLPHTTTVPVSGDGLLRRRTSYGYDDGGRKTAQDVALVDATGAVVQASAGAHTFSYAPNDRLLSETGRGNTGTISTSYDAAGNRIRTLDSTSSSTLTATFYLDDLLRSGSDELRTTSYGYDAAGALTARAHSTALGAAVSDTTYSYNDSGLPTGQSSDVTGATGWTWGYDPGGRVKTETQPNGRSVTLGYNPDSTLARHTLSAGTTTVAEHSYTYDALLRITSQTLAAGAVGAGGSSPVTGRYGYAYDSAGRLDSFDDRGEVKDVSFDASGNRTRYGDLTFSYNPDDTIAVANSSSGLNPKTYSYTLFGGVSDDGCSTYSYDPFDRLGAAAAKPSLTSGCAATGSSQYRYDGLDRQISTTHTPTGGSSTTTALHYNAAGSSLLGQTSSGANARPTMAYVLDAAGTTKAVGTGSAVELLTDDGRGNISTITNSTGAVVCTARFDPYGSPQAATGDKNGTCNTGTSNSDVFYSGERRDRITGNYQLGSRTYDPSKASFLTADSYRNGSSTQNLSVGVDPLTRNTYAYVNGDPINLVDPDGHEPRPHHDRNYRDPNPHQNDSLEYERSNQRAHADAQVRQEQQQAREARRARTLYKRGTGGELLDRCVRAYVGPTNICAFSMSTVHGVNEVLKPVGAAIGVTDAQSCLLEQDRSACVIGGIAAAPGVGPVAGLVARATARVATPVAKFIGKARRGSGPAAEAIPTRRVGLGVTDEPSRVAGPWSRSDLQRGAFGRPPRDLGSPELHHADQMPGSGIHEVDAVSHRARGVHGRPNQGVTPAMRDSDRQLHWWYRSQQMGGWDELGPSYYYNNWPGVG